MNFFIFFIFIFLIFILISFYFFNKLPKFFNEGINPHLDARFENINNNYIIHDQLIKLLKFFSNYCNSKNIKFILAHGGLIGYKFNKKLLPWDDDIDVIMLNDEFLKLTNYENDNFLIEINPYSQNFSIFDIKNKISGRVICKKTGLFIDITNYYIDKNLIKCKDGHSFKYNDIFPLIKTQFENIDIYVPNNIDNILIKEYGKKVLLPKYKNWHFINNQWIKK